MLETRFIQACDTSGGGGQQIHAGHRAATSMEPAAKPWPQGCPPMGPTTEQRRHSRLDVGVQVWHVWRALRGARLERNRLTGHSKCMDSRCVAWSLITVYGILSLFDCQRWGRCRLPIMPKKKQEQTLSCHFWLHPTDVVTWDADLSIQLYRSHFVTVAGIAMRATRASCPCLQSICECNNAWTPVFCVGVQHMHVLPFLLCP
jgi:hypothetical protein